jgi:hypothetical protein
VEVDGRPLVSLGSDIADGGGGGVDMYTVRRGRGGKDQSLKWGLGNGRARGDSGDGSRSGSTTDGYGSVIMS